MLRLRIRWHASAERQNWRNRRTRSGEVSWRMLGQQDSESPMLYFR